MRQHDRPLYIMTGCEIAYSTGTHFSGLGPVSEPARTLTGRLTSP